MEYALLGRTGLRVSRIALGTAVLGLSPTADGSDALVHAALDLGVTLFDCANTYGNRPSFDRPGLPRAAERHHAEELLGRALRGHRDDVVLCSKVSEPISDRPNDRGLSRYHILREVERSLRRLDTDHIDIYHFHHPDGETAIEESLRAADDLVRQGKIRYVALSTYNGWQLAQAVMTAEHRGLARPVLDQVHYNMLDRSVEDEVAPAAAEFGLGLTCFSPLAGGALAGAAVMDRPFSGQRRWGMDVAHPPAHRAAGVALDELAREWGHPPAHLALAWLYSRPAVAAAVIGPESSDELRENVGSVDVQLDNEQLARLDQIGRAKNL